MMENKKVYWYDHQEGGVKYQGRNGRSIPVGGKAKLFWLSIKPISKCLFSRRNGYTGKHILKYSICLRLFGKDIL